ncbi:uncharacterized protein LOC144464187 [Epinephelus lanceolatus]
MSLRSPQCEIGYQASVDTTSLTERAADLRRKIVSKLETWSLRRILKLSCHVPSDDLLEDVNAALNTMPTRTITETNKLIHSTATVILEMLGYKMDMVHTNQYPPWKRRLEAKIKATQRQVNQLAELHRGNMVNKGLPRKYNKLPIPEALKTAKQRLTAPATRLKRYTREVEARRINRILLPRCSLNGREITAGQTHQKLRWKHTGRAYGKEKHLTTPMPKWLVDLGAGHSNLPEQEPVTISMADIQERVSKMKSWTAPDPDMIHTYWLKKLTALHERLVAQMSQLADTGQDSPDHERPPEGNHSIQLQTDNLSLHNMETPVRHHSSQDN